MGFESGMFLLVSSFHVFLSTTDANKYYYPKKKKKEQTNADLINMCFTKNADKCVVCALSNYYS